MDFKAIKNLTYISQVAFIMLTPILLGVWGGNWVDAKLGTSPWILMVGIVIGVSSAFLNLYKFVMKAAKDNEKEKAEDYIPNSDKSKE
jgi:F0F1-type ATP synthase assembly protein I